jgi:hypothetical protein
MSQGRLRCLVSCSYPQAAGRKGHIWLRAGHDHFPNRRSLFVQGSPAAKLRQLVFSSRLARAPVLDRCCV